MQYLKIFEFPHFLTHNKYSCQNENAKHLVFVIIESPQNDKTKACFCMINYNRLGYEIKRNFTNFSLKISKGLNARRKNLFTR